MTKILSLYWDETPMPLSAILFFGGDSNGRRFFAVKFNGVADQVLEELHQLARVDSDRWKVVMGNDCATFFDGAAQVF